MMTKRTIAAAALFALGAPLAQADGFGGLDIARSHDVNFTGAPKGSPKTAENITVYSGHLGNYWPSADARSALILKADVALARLDRFSVLDNETYGLGFGGYHSFSPANSMNALVGASTRRFEDRNRNLNVYSAQLGFKQNAAESFWVREGVLLEKGVERTNANNYSGYGLNASLNWSPARATVLMLGMGRNVRVYDVQVADRRTSDQLTLGAVQQLGEHLYLRAGASRQANKTNAGNRYDTTVYTVGIGASF